MGKELQIVAANNFLRRKRGEHGGFEDGSHPAYGLSILKSATVVSSIGCSQSVQMRVESINRAAWRD